MYESNEGDRIPYSQFLGCGPPLDVLGIPGDIFVDITRGAYGVFVKYAARWVEWAGVKRCDAFMRHIIKTTQPALFHPKNEKLMIWCTKEDVVWIPRTVLQQSCRQLFIRHPGRSVISAGEMIEESTVLEKKIAVMYEGERERLRAHTPSALAINIRHTTAFCYSTTWAETSTTCLRCINCMNRN